MDVEKTLPSGKRPDIVDNDNQAIIEIWSGNPDTEMTKIWQLIDYLDEKGYSDGVLFPYK